MARSVCLDVGSLLLLALPAAVLAHDLGGIDLQHRLQEEAASKLTQKIQRPQLSVPNLPHLMAAADKERALQILGSPSDPNSVARALALGRPGIESIINERHAWNPGTTLRVCFSTPENNEVKKVVVAVAEEWTKHANVKFDFGAAPAYAKCQKNDGRMIRINLQAAGTTSLVGTEAKGKDLTNEDTIFFARADTKFFNSSRFRWLVLHEFGHALGLEHEHQHPAKNCMAQLDVDLIRETFNWDEPTAKRSLARIDVSSATQSSKFFTTGTTANGTVTYTDYDPQSVMHYDLKPEFFKQSPPGDCYVEAVRTTPSEVDRRAIARAYPKGNTKDLVNKHNQILALAIKETPALTKLQQEALRALMRKP